MDTYRDPWVAWYPWEAWKPLLPLEGIQSLLFFPVALEQPVEIFSLFLSFQPCSGKSRLSNPNSLWLLGHEAEGQKTIILIENRIRIYCFSNCA